MSLNLKANCCGFAKLCPYRFPIKKFADRFNSVTFVETSHLNTDVCKFSSS